MLSLLECKCKRKCFGLCSCPLNWWFGPCHRPESGNSSLTSHSKSTSYQLPATSYQQPATSYQLPAINYQLPATSLPLYQQCSYHYWPNRILGHECLGTDWCTGHWAEPCQETEPWLLTSASKTTASLLEGKGIETAGSKMTISHEVRAAVVGLTPPILLG